MKQQFTAMLALQDSMNLKVHPEWRSQNFEWYRAIWTECAELLDHYGWKWWKKQNPDIDQIKLEIVDIWHFGMSIFLANGTDIESIADEILTGWDISHQTDDLRIAIEQLAQNTLSSHTMDIKLFCQLMSLTDMDLDELYRQYIGKNVLNFFRQDHGYKDGSYIKVWNGKEDNEVLANVLTMLDPQSESFKDEVYQALEQAYPS